jgi:gamma-glutamylputrescine oxidase
MSLEGVALLRRRIERWRIPCRLVEGVVEASWFADEARIESRVAAMNRLGAHLEPWSGERLREAYRSRRFRGGFLDPDGLHLDPLALCRGLATAAAELQVRIFEDTPARALHPGVGGQRVETVAGEVRARQVVMCTSVGRPGLVPALNRAMLPIRTHIVVTEALGSQLAEAVRAPYAVYDDRTATGYFRPLPGQRLLWGGRVDALGEPRRLQETMRRDLAHVFPQLADAGLELAWSGIMGFARHRMPVVRPLGPGLWVAVGFGGHGLNTTMLAGELVATALAEDDRRWQLLEAFDLPWNGGALGAWTAQLLYRFWQAGDVMAGLAARSRTR